MPFSEVSSHNPVGSLLTFSVRLLKWLWHALIAVLLFPYYLIRWIIRGILKFLHWILPNIYAENLYHASRLIGALFFILLFGALLCVILLGGAHLAAVFGAAQIFKDVDVAQALLVAVKAIIVTGVIFVALAAGGFLLTSLLAMFGITVYSSTKTLMDIPEELTESRLVLIAMFIVAVVIFGVVYAMFSGLLPI